MKHCSVVSYLPHLLILSVKALFWFYLRVNFWNLRWFVTYIILKCFFKKLTRCWLLKWTVVIIFTKWISCHYHWFACYFHGYWHQLLSSKNLLKAKKDARKLPQDKNVPFGVTFCYFLTFWIFYHCMNWENNLSDLIHIWRSGTVVYHFVYSFCHTFHLSPQIFNKFQCFFIKWHTQNCPDNNAVFNERGFPVVSEMELVDVLDIFLFTTFKCSTLKTFKIHFDSAPSVIFTKINLFVN